ncbi:TetR/AcrR family transcriptional regulator [Micromonospora sp. KC721]|uniref:TetR/AcrR family transcriptional regulator n=1 Tax=Micromonospora sp. KC721 TaxID=2530380 RepID=UPI001053D3AD|nr:TetR/AcrR family transcriptional regulator [Micromonospora sp. KC721]TDB78808.1 TetR/AcrR family transcriptional regulator [Micromonospora sp. KC721]
MTDTQESGTRTRTRQAIIDAAIEMLGQDPSATLGEIATAANVGRTTLHRYFPERSDLLTALSAEGTTRLNRATDNARLDEGTGADALRRLCHEYFELGSLLSLIFSEPQLIDDADWSEQGACDPRLSALVERGHHDGTIDPELPATWIQSVLWSQLYAGWSYLADTRISRHEALRLVVRTLSGAIAPKS